MKTPTLLIVLLLIILGISACKVVQRPAPKATACPFDAQLIRASERKCCYRIVVQPFLGNYNAVKIESSHDNITSIQTAAAGAVPHEYAWQGWSDVPPKHNFSTSVSKVMWRYNSRFPGASATEVGTVCFDTSVSGPSTLALSFSSDGGTYWGCQDYQLINCGPTKCTPYPDNMTLWFPFDESGGSTTQELLNAYTGQLLNGAGFYTSGIVANSLNLDGVDDHVVVPNPTINLQDHFTVDAWVFPTSNAPMAIISKMVEPDFPGSWPKGFELFLDQGIPWWHWSCHPMMGCTEAWHPGSPTYGAVPLNTWSHIAITIDRTQPSNGFKCYINGVLSNTTPVNITQSVANNSDLFIGRQSNYVPSPGRYFAGKIDEVEIFNRVLSPMEISDIYHAGNQGKCKENVDPIPVCCRELSPYIPPPTITVMPYDPRIINVSGSFYTGVPVIRVVRTIVSATQKLVCPGPPVENAIPSVYQYIYTNEITQDYATPTAMSPGTYSSNIFVGADPPECIGNLKCFDAIELCIKWSFTDENCQTCEVVRCYEVRRRCLNDALPAYQQEFKEEELLEQIPVDKNALEKIWNPENK